MNQHSSFHPAGGLRALAKLVLPGLVSLCAISLLTTPVHGATRTYNAGLFWSNADNWNPVGTPQDGDTLIFGAAGTVFTAQNDMTNLRVHDIQIINQGIRLQGNPILLETGISCSATFGSEIYNDIQFTGGGGAVTLTGTGPGYLDMHGNVTLAINQQFSIILNPFFGDPSQGGLLRFYGVIQGGGSVAKFGDGPLYLLGDSPNTYTGGTSFRQGNIHLQKADNVVAVPAAGLLELGVIGVSQASVFCEAAGQLGALGVGVAVSINDSHLHLSTFDDKFGRLTMQEGATVDGSGTLTLSGNLTSTSGNFIPAITVRLALPIGGHIFNIGGSQYAGLDMQAQIVGVGGFTKSGTAALLLESSNSFDGIIDVTQGVLDVRNNHALGSTVGGTILSGSGSLTLRNVIIAGETLFARGQQPIVPETAGSLLFGVGVCGWSGPIQLDTNLVVSSTDLCFIGGPISGLGGLDFRGSRNQMANATIGPNPNSYTGLTRVRSELLVVSADNAIHGPLIVGGGTEPTNEINWGASSFSVLPDVTLYPNGLANLNGHDEQFVQLRFNGGHVITGSGHLFLNGVVANPTNVTATMDGNVVLASTPITTFDVADGPANPDLTINAIISDGLNVSGIVKQGGGELLLSAANTFRGANQVLGGVVIAENESSLGTTGAGTTVSSNATLELDGLTQTFAEPLHIRGTGRGGTNGAIYCRQQGVISSTITLDAPATIRCDDTSSQFLLLSTISGTGPLTKTGPGILNLGGSSANTYTGDTLANNGSLWLSKPQFVIAAPGNLVLGPAPLASPAIALFFQTGEMGGDTVTVNANSSLNLNGNNQGLSRLNLNDGGAVQTGSGILGLAEGGVVAVGSQSIFGSRVGSSITGKIGFPDTGGVTFTVGLYGSFLPVPIAPELDVPAIISGSSSLFFNGLIKEGSGQMRLSGNNTFPGQVRINEGKLRVDGVQPQSQVAVTSGTLGGTGTVGRVFINGSSAVVAPGGSPGILTCSNFNAGSTGPGTLQMELNGTTPGSGYDQINVHGTVNLTSIALSASLNFVSSVSNQFIIINNDGADSVLGTFNGLPQNAPLFIGGEQFLISYTGGTGNDVVLTRIPTPLRPVLTIERAPPASVRLLWPTNDPAFTLQFSTNLTTTNWVSGSPPPVVLGTNNVVTNTPSDAQRFYRLFKP